MGWRPGKAPDAAAEHIRQRPPAVREAVVAALDDWIDLVDDPKLAIDEPHSAWLRGRGSGGAG